MNAFRIGWRQGLASLLRASIPYWFLGALAVGAGYLKLESRLAPDAALERVLFVLLCGLLPLASLGLSRAARDEFGCPRAVSWFARRGMSRRPLVVAWLAARTAGLIVALSGLLALVFTLVGNAGADSLSDLATCLVIGSAGTFAYMSLFECVRALGRHAVVAWAVLVGDQLLGRSNGKMAWLTVRAHVQNLLGSTDSIPTDPRVSLLVLTLVGLVAPVLWYRRKP